MTDVNKVFQQTLKSRGYSLTEARSVVFDFLRDKEPQTMSQIVKACPSINQTSVYRTIALFEQLSIVQKLQIGWKYKIELTDSFHDHHHHLTCQRCGTIIPFEEGDELDHYLQKIARSKQFIMHDHQLEIQGLCSKCQPKYA